MASTSFIFVEFLNETGCSCLRLESDATVSAPFAHRSFDDIKMMQFESNTIVVIPAARCGIYDVELPWLNEQKARAAIPYVLEEQLAQNVSDLHFAFDKAHHQNDHYLVAVVDKSYLLDLGSRLEAVGVDFNQMTVDWFALKSDEIALTPSAVLVRTTAYQGALLGELAVMFLKNAPESCAVLSFVDSAVEWDHLTSTAMDTSFYHYVAQRLQQQPFINLCQGEFSHGDNHDVVRRRWRVVAVGLAGAWLLIALMVNTIDLIRLNHQLNRVDDDIARVYRQFFPGASQVISPRFRISQLLNTGQGLLGSTTLWRLLDKLDKAFDANHLTLTQLDYKANALLVTLKGDDFSRLESFSQALKQAQVNVTQTQASSHEDNVSATLELRL